MGILLLVLSFLSAIVFVAIVVSKRHLSKKRGSFRHLCLFVISLCSVILFSSGSVYFLYPYRIDVPESFYAEIGNIEKFIWIVSPDPVDRYNANQLRSQVENIVLKRELGYHPIDTYLSSIPENDVVYIKVFDYPSNDPSAHTVCIGSFILVLSDYKLSRYYPANKTFFDLGISSQLSLSREQFDALFSLCQAQLDSIF